MTQLLRYPIKMDLGLYAGDRYEIPFQWTSELTGDGYPLDAYTWAALVRAGDAAGAVVWDLGPDMDMTDLATGRLLVVVTAAATRSLVTVEAPEFAGTWDLQRTLIADPLVVKTIGYGDVTCSLDRTRED